MTKGQWVGQSEFAREIRKSRQFVHRLKEQGLIKSRGQRIHRQSALDFLSKGTGQKEQGETEGDEISRLGPMSRVKLASLGEKFKRDRFENELLQMELQKTRSQLIERKIFLTAAFEVNRTLRDKVLTILPTTIAAEMFGSKLDRHEFFMAIEKHVTRVWSEWLDSINALLKSEWSEKDEFTIGGKK
jgi:hypothetical protein